MGEFDDNLRVLHQVLVSLTELQIPYALGGSLASSLLGKPRFTFDADITVEPFFGKEQAVQARLGSDFYLSQGAIQQAHQHQSSFNIIHSATGFKIDVFIRKDRAFDQSFMSRRRTEPLADQSGKTIVVVSPEDIILLKLEWFRLGGETSDRQWSDVLGVLQVQGEKLDQSYLDHWAADLHVEDLLTRARKECVESFR